MHSLESRHRSKGGGVVAVAVEAADTHPEILLGELS
jgi:hypothetical protein